MTEADDADGIRSKLDEHHAAAARRVRELARSFDGIVEASADVATDDEHDPEGHTIAWERQQVAALLGEARTSLADLERARDRLAEGAYGTCRTCGTTIGAERLSALPSTETCVACAR